MVLISVCWITATVLPFVSSMNFALVLEGGSWRFSVVIVVSTVVATAVIEIVVAGFPVVGIVRVDQGKLA